MKKLDAALLPDFKTWTAPPLPSEIPHGDMPGDKVHIGDDHIAKANRVFPALLEKAEAVLQQNPFGRCVVTVCGGSGVGKSETASLLSYYFTSRAWELHPQRGQLPAPRPDVQRRRTPAHLP